jgi:hypothetical protein
MPRMDICSIVSRKLTQLFFQSSLPESPVAEELVSPGRGAQPLVAHVRTSGCSCPPSRLASRTPWKWRP